MTIIKINTQIWKPLGEQIRMRHIKLCKGCNSCKNYINSINGINYVEVFCIVNSYPLTDNGCCSMFGVELPL